MRLVVKHHIAMKIAKKHGVAVAEVFEVLEGNFLYKRVKGNRYRIIGKTLGGRFLTIFVDKEGQIYELVTARDSTDSEKRLYKKEIEV
jgi:uncharacterized DUF497 family protein